MRVYVCMYVCVCVYQPCSFGLSGREYFHCPSVHVVHECPVTLCVHTVYGTYAHTHMLAGRVNEGKSAYPFKE